MKRIIGIIHRTKKTVAGEARPTQLAIAYPTNKNKKRTKRALATEEEELSFLLARPPFETLGLQKGDLVAMVLGGSGDRLAYAIARRLSNLFGELVRITPALFKAKREEYGYPEDKSNDQELLLDLVIKDRKLFQEDKSNDQELSLDLVIKDRHLFQVVGPRDLELIKIREAYFARIEAMKARIGCEQRLHQRFIGKIFLSDEGCYSEGAIEDLFDQEKASDPILLGLVKEETEREKELKKLVRQSEVWKKVFEPVHGCGELIAVRLIASIGDIRRFRTPAQLKSFCGVHVMADGRFARRRKGELAGWSGDARQALYLLADQFNRSPNSVWGKKLREYKAKLKLTHPEVVEVPNGKGKTVKKYTDGHLQKMALWRVATRFVEALHRDWTRAMM